MWSSILRAEKNLRAFSGSGSRQRSRIVKPVGAVSPIFPSRSLRAKSLHAPGFTSSWAESQFLREIKARSFLFLGATSPGISTVISQSFAFSAETAVLAATCGPGGSMRETCSETCNNNLKKDHGGLSRFVPKRPWGAFEVCS